MKRSTLLAALAAAAFAGCATLAIDDTQFGLSKSSVFDVATPTPFAFDGPGAGKTTIAPLPGSGVPPMISHAVEDHLPITVTANACLTCHDRPQAIGKPRSRGQPAAASASHYHKGADGRLVLAGTQYNCMACHAPQASVKPLVDNTSR